MAKNKEETEIKTDGWKDTFSDLMNLLLCFFILLYSMSSIDEAKYAELVASLSNSVSIFSGGEKAIGQGQLISSGATQLNNLDEYYSDMGNRLRKLRMQMIQWQSWRRNRHRKRKKEWMSCTVML